MTVVVWLGPAPADEPVATDVRTVRRYQAAVRLVVGDEPPGAKLRVFPAPSDRPHPFELACEYDPADAEAVAYAERCRTTAPTTWAAAGLSATDLDPDLGRW